jgi:hypothetical protein
LWQPDQLVVTPVEGGEQLEVCAWSCYCRLSDDEWADRGAVAAESLDDWGTPDASDVRDVRRVAEDDPA